MKRKFLIKIKTKIDCFIQLLFKIKLFRRTLPMVFWERMSRINGLHRLFVNKRLNKIDINKQANGKKILFLRMRHVPRHLALEVALATKLTFEGNECLFVGCSPILPICNAWDIRDINPQKTCNFCSNNNIYFSEKFPFNMLFLKDQISNDEIERIKNKYQTLQIDDLKSFRINDIDINMDDELYLSLAKFLFRGNVPKNQKNLQYARDFAVAAEIIAKGLLRIFEKEEPDIVVLNAGHIFWYGIAYKILNKLKIKTVSYDETNIAVTKLTWIFDDTNPCVDYNWTNHWEKRKNIDLSNNDIELIDNFIEKRKKYFLYQENTNTIPLLKKYDIKNYKIKVALFTNVLWDATVVGKNPIFNSMIDWISYTISVFNKNSDACLIIRVHPAEAGIYGMVSHERVKDELYYRGVSLNENIIFIDAEENVNSYDVLNESEFVLAYASNIGLEAVLEGKPVIVLGSPHYKNKGFTFDPSSIAEYQELLKKVLSGEKLLKPNTYLAKKYVKLAFLDTQVELNIFSDNHPHMVSSLNLTSFDKYEEFDDFSLFTKWIKNSGQSGFFLKEN